MTQTDRRTQKFHQINNPSSNQVFLYHTSFTVISSSCKVHRRLGIKSQQNRIESTDIDWNTMTQTNTQTQRYTKVPSSNQWSVIIPIPQNIILKTFFFCKFIENHCSSQHIENYRPCRGSKDSGLGRPLRGEGMEKPLALTTTSQAVSSSLVANARSCCLTFSECA